jgi:hypothetical protein
MECPLSESDAIFRQRCLLSGVKRTLTRQGDKSFPKVIHGYEARKRYLRR